MWTMEKDGREEYPEESVDWEQIGQKDEMWWCTKAIDKRSNAELVQSGVFAGEITVIRVIIQWIAYSKFLSISLIRLIFLFLELLAIKDTATRPRGDVRRGEIWANVAFHLSDKPIRMLSELERMSRGKTKNNSFDWMTKNES